MYQDKAKNPVIDNDIRLDEPTFEAMWELFEAIGIFWGNLPDSGIHRSRLRSFMVNRIALIPLYAEYYSVAREVIDALVVAYEGNRGAAYERLFTDADANRAPPSTRLGLARQMVANEFITLQMALEGFRAFGAENWPGFFGGANELGRPPYRPKD